ncbi:MAG: hypothetical protein JEZ09_09750 [Salinivirgaceae bacterium]|nr:hypothetical protein [Salinivirgaceae bacterium]
MPKIRDLKNEVNYLIFEIISDCNTFMSFHPEKKEEAVKLVEEAVELRNNLIQKIIHPETVSAKYFKDLRIELISGADNIFEKLRGLIK